METKKPDVVVETTAKEVEKTAEEKFLDTMKEQDTECVLVTVNKGGVHLYKNADLPQVLGLLATAKVMTDMELTRGINGGMQRPPMPQQPQSMNS